MADSERITPPWWLKPMNKVFMTVMRLGIVKDGPMVLMVPGRKSGKPRSTPITPFSVDGKRPTRPDEFEALAGRCAVFRFDPTS